MNVVSAVINLQKELDWYKQTFKEAQEVIKQMSGQPPEGFEYIHPWDFAELLMNAEILPEITLVNRATSQPIYEMVNGKRYKQSALIPAKTKKYK